MQHGSLTKDIRGIDFRRAPTLGQTSSSHRLSECLIFSVRTIQDPTRRRAMLKRMFVSSIVLVAFSACKASAQGICPLNGTPSSNLVCVLPQLYGPSGLGSGTGAPLLANGHQAHFAA